MHDKSSCIMLKTNSLNGKNEFGWGLKLGVVDIARHRYGHYAHSGRQVHVLFSNTPERVGLCQYLL